MEDPLKTQVAGSHYKDMAIQPIEFIHANKIPFIEGNVITYVVRHRSKNKAEDIRKAIRFLELLLKLEYGADEQTDVVPLVEEAKQFSALFDTHALYGPKHVPAGKADIRARHEFEDPKRGCPAVAPDVLKLLCTLDAGHSGPHQAFAGGDKPDQVWNDNPETTSPAKLLDDAFGEPEIKPADAHWTCPQCFATLSKDNDRCDICGTLSRKQ